MGGNHWKAPTPRKGEEGVTSDHPCLLLYEVTSRHTFNNPKKEKWMWMNGFHGGLTFIAAIMNVSGQKICSTCSPHSEASMDYPKNIAILSSVNLK